MHPLENIRGASSTHLQGRHIVLGICGSIACVETVKLGRELARHGAEVHAVMTEQATKLIGVDSVWFATGRPPITKLTGDVEHVSLLANVPGRADLFLVAPATADFVGKVAHGLDDDPVTTCATVAIGNRVPMLVAPAMDEAMMQHPKVQSNVRALEEMGIEIVAPKLEEHKAKVAEWPDIVDAVIARLQPKTPRKRALVIGGGCAEPVDDARVLTNRSSGLSAVLLARELVRRGVEVEFWLGHATTQERIPVSNRLRVKRFDTSHDLQAAIQGAKKSKTAFDAVYVPAAISDYAPKRQEGKLRSGAKSVRLELQVQPKILPLLREAWPKAYLVSWKLEPEGSDLEAAARPYLLKGPSNLVVANHASAFGAEISQVLLVSKQGEGLHTELLAGGKRELLQVLVDRVHA